MDFNKHKLIRITTVPISLDKLLGEQLSFMNQFYEVIAVSSDKNELKKLANKFGVEHHCIEMERKISILRDIVSLWKFYNFCKREKPSIVHSHTPKAGLVGMLGAKLAGVPFRLHTVAGLPLMEASGLKRKILNIVEKVVYASATKVYPNSRGLADFILENKFCAASKLKVFGNGSSNGIDSDYFDPNLISDNLKKELCHNLNLEINDFVFIFVGRLVGDKGINELVKAFVKIKNTKAKLLLVGNFEPELDPLLKETLDIINSNKNIISTGFQADVRPYFAVSDVLVFPSYREGFPNVVLQAGAMGLACIVSNINGCNEIIQDRRNGIIIPVKNAEKIYDAMQIVLTESVLLKDMKSVSREEIVKKFDQDFLWNQILKEYRTFIPLQDEE